MFCDGLYKIISKEENKVIVQLSNKEHPIFKAHFPQKPILPGFVHFEIITDAFDIEITTIKKTKFTKMINPKEILTYERNENKFKVFSNNEEVVNISL